jgi:FPC/CPF motif-containing protein YcgG
MNMTSDTVEKMDGHIKELISKRNYPCIAAIQSMRQGEYRIGIYEKFGTGASAEALAKDLIAFRNLQKQTQSIFLSFWAVFVDSTVQDDDDFEASFWQELSALSTKDNPETGWDKNFSKNPHDKNFCFSFDGDAFFLVGMHANSSRLGRRFPYPAIVFNLYEQFEELDRRGEYHPMIKTNRQRDIKFQGNVNPMVEQYSDVWEAIQFSGRKNPPNWKCPFKHAETL